MTDKICDYDEAYTRKEASEIGWCSECSCKSCPYNKKKKQHIKE